MLLNTVQGGQEQMGGDLPREGQGHSRCRVPKSSVLDDASQCSAAPTQPSQKGVNRPSCHVRCLVGALLGNAGTQHLRRLHRQA